MSYLRNSLIEGQLLAELKPSEVKWYGKSKVGIKGNNNTGIVIHNQLLARHILCMGSIGSGKSVTLYHIIDAIRKSANRDDVFIFFDAKGDYLNNFYHSGDYVISNEINPPEGTVYWNIYEDILATTPEKRDETIREIATTLFKEDIEGSSAPVFATGARDLFAAILSSQVRNIELKGEYWNHQKLVEWLQKATDTSVRILLKEYEDLKWVRNYISKESSTSSKQSFFMHLYQNIFNIFSGAFAKSGDFSIKRSINQKNGKAIFLEYDISNGNNLNPVYTLMLDLAMKEVLGRSESESKGNIYFILDEFPLIPKLNYMDNALNFGRSLGVKVIAGIQNVSQVENTYGPSLGSSIITGFGTVFAFRLFDAASRSLVVNRHGRNKKLISIGSSNASKGVQDMITDGNVIEDWDLTSLKIGECIVSPFNGEPFLFHPINY
ncbi:type IV secretion system DNA-binding domain-containing protein [Fictibacillus sp. UD]|uniref:type IV secretory system conjugative DNA transfer family protein n=1 Tax=Fictibacillus sp. UD TaxID=3038777 RepID=UPI0037452B94